MSKKKDIPPSKYEQDQAKKQAFQLKEQEKLNAKQDQIKNSLDKSGDLLEKNVNKSDAILEASKAQTAIDEMRRSGDNARANILQQKLDTVNSILGNNNATAEQIVKGQEIAKSLLEQSNDVNKKSENYLEAAANNDDTLRGLKVLNATLSEQKDFMKADMESFETEKAIKSLEGFMGRKSDETTMQLRSAYEEATVNLKSAIESGDDEAAEIAKRQLEEIKKGAETEEERREAAKMAELQAGALFQMGDKLEGLGEKMDGMGLAAKGGFLAGIAGLFLMFTDPEKFRAILVSVMGAIDGFFTSISLLLQGDVSGAMEAMEGHWGTFAAIVGSIGVLFLGKIVALLGGAFKKMQMLIKAVQVFRVFMMTSFIPGMVAAFSAMIAAVTPIVVAMAVPLAIIAGIAAVFFLFKVALEKIRDALGFTSVFDVLLLGFAYLSDGIAHMVNAVTGVINFVIGIVEKIGRFIPGLGDLDLPKIPKMATNNAAKKKLELQAKADEAALKEAAEKQEENIQDIEGIPSDISAEEIERVQGQQTDLKLDSQRDKPINNVNQIQTNTTKGGDNISTAVFHLPPSPAAYALGDLGGR